MLQLILLQILRPTKKGQSYYKQIQASFCEALLPLSSIHSSSPPFNIPIIHPSLFSFLSIPFSSFFPPLLKHHCSTTLSSFFPLLKHHCSTTFSSFFPFPFSIAETPLFNNISPFPIAETPLFNNISLFPHC
jgi:hypothetical protein